MNATRKHRTWARRLRWGVGLLLWLAAGVGLWIGGRTIASPTHSYSQVVPTLWQFATGRRPVVSLKFAEPAIVRVGDPIFAANAHGELHQVGEIHRVLHGAESLATSSSDTITQGEALFYPQFVESHKLAGDVATPFPLRLTYYETPNSLDWVASTLLPPEKRALIAREIALSFEQNRDDVLAALQPIVEATLRESVAVVEQDLPGVLESNRSRLIELGSKYQDEIVQRELIPLAKEELWPMVRQRAQPVAEEVGLELWQKLSVWRFAWRYAYDSISFSDRKLTQDEWQRFVENDAMPTLTEHAPQFVALVQQVMRDSANNKKVREVLRANFGKMINDPELQGLVWDVIQQTLVDNPRIREVLVRNWSGPQAKAAFQLASQRFEPTARRIGDLILGTPETGISPEFAQVLRHQVLAKDRRWLLAEWLPDEDLLPTKSGQALLVRRGKPVPPLPFVPPEVVNHNTPH